MNCKFLIKKDNNLAIEKFEGNIMIEDILNFFNAEYQHPDYPYVKKIIVDLRKCRFNFYEVCDENAELLVGRHSENKNYFSMIYITNSPIETAFSTLCLKYLQVKNGFFSVCSTVETALRFLNLEICPADYETLINNI